MATFSDTLKSVYDKVNSILNTDADLLTFNTIQPGFFPAGDNLTNPKWYPWVFAEFGGIGMTDVFRSPRNWDYELNVYVIALTFADRGHPEDMVFSSGVNENPGIGDIALNLRKVFWKYKPNRFDVVGVNDWNITRTGVPTFPIIQPLLMHEYIRGIQLDLAFQIVDRT